MKTVLSLFLLSFSIAANAAEVWHSAKIKHIYPLNNGTFILTFNASHPSCTNANSPQYFYVTVGQGGVTTEGAQNMLSVALTAGAQGKPIAFVFDDATTGCYINRLLVDMEQ